MKLLRNSFGIIAAATLMAASMAPAHADSADESTQHENDLKTVDNLETAEVRDIIHGEDIVVVFPETDGPKEGVTSDFIPTGPIEDDVQVVIADSDGTIPGGLSQESIEELDESGKLTQDNVEATIDSQNVTDSEASPSASFCFNATAGPVGTGSVVSTSTSGFIGTDNFARIGYTFQLTAGTNQQGSISGLGYQRVQSGGEIGHQRIWQPMGIVSPDTVGTGDAPWGIVSATPQIQLASTTIHLAQARWCF